MLAGPELGQTVLLTPHQLRAQNNSDLASSSSLQSSADAENRLRSALLSYKVNQFEVSQVSRRGDSVMSEC